MRFSISILIITVLICFSCASCKSKKETTADDKTEKEVIKIPTLAERLEGLTKMSSAELGDYEVTIDGKSLPVYTPEGKQLEGMELVNYIKANPFVYEVFGNAERDPKAIVLMKEKEAEVVDVEDEEIPLPPGMETKLEYAPAFTGTDMQGNDWSLEKLKGKIAVLNFWFVTCAPCKEEIPELNALKAKYANNENVEFIAFTFNEEKDVKEFLKDIPFDYNIVTGAKKIMDDYIVLGFPTNMVLDQNNDIAYQAIGYRHRIDKIIDKKISELLE